MTPRGLRTLALASSLALALAACGGEPTKEQSPSASSSAEASATEETSGPAIVVEGEDTEDDAQDDAAEPLPSITPSGLDLSALTSTCTDEGVVTINKGGTPEPALEGFEGTLGYKGWDDKGNGESTATLGLDTGNGERTLGPLNVGDSFTLGDATYSVTSICEDAIEFDIID